MVDFKKTLERKRAEKQTDIQAKDLSENAKLMLAPRMPKGSPIAEIPDDWKDGRKVLVYGLAKYYSSSEFVSDSKAWRIAEYSVCEWVCDNDCVEALKVTHFLPYPAEPV